MATVKAKDIRLKTEKELAEQILALKKEQFNMRFQKATGQLTHTDRQRQVKREIAKIQTIMTERRRKAQSAA
ncbi:MAG: 50S ribosomal protein L29 [Alphaproteobacteria bacterium]|nr:50S ribosomal protein L29 [Alphaproteobacteria bacterium]